jgi:hypothetical protein
MEGRGAQLDLTVTIAVTARDIWKGDQMLMQRAAAGDGQAFAELVAPYRAELLRFAHRMLHDNSHAGEEVVQEALLKAYRALEQGTRPENVHVLGPVGRVPAAGGID